MQRLAKAGLLALITGSLSLPALGAQDRRFELSVVVDGVPLPEYPWRDRSYIEALRGRPFSLRVSNPTSERVAVAISVDGRSVVDAKRTSALQAAKWVLYPGQTIDIPGWQVSGEAARRFFFTETARSYAKWLGDTANVGTIEAVFFRERRKVPQPVAVLPLPDREVAETWSGGTGDEQPSRDAPKRAEAPSAPSSEAHQDSRGAGTLKAQPKDADGLAATGIGERTRFPVQWVQFDEDPAPAARIALRYEFRPELVRLGVLRRGDDLFLRERARGFEPEYAPDPDRHRSQ
jgi:hypothetical protein